MGGTAVCYDMICSLCATNDTAALVGTTHGCCSVFFPLCQRERAWFIRFRPSFRVRTYIRAWYMMIHGGCCTEFHLLLVACVLPQTPRHGIWKRGIVCVFDLAVVVVVGNLCAIWMEGLSRCLPACRGFRTTPLSDPRQRAFDAQQGDKGTE